MSCCQTSDSRPEAHDLAKRIDADDKRLINCQAVDVNQLMPLKYTWAWEHYLNGCANNWMPTEVSMQRDIELWKSNRLNSDERRVIMRNLGFFSTAESLVGNNIVLAVFKHVTNPECRQFLLRQAFEEAIHCYAEGTEILSERGFVDFRDLRPGEQVAQYHEDGSIDFTVPDQILKDRYQGELISFRHDRYHSIVTPQHRCVALDPRDGGKVKIIKAKGFFPHNYQIPTAGKLHNDQAAPLTDAERFRIAFQADGSSHDAEQIQDAGETLPIRFQFKRSEKIERLTAILSRLGWQTNTEKITEGRNAGQTIVRVRVPKEEYALVDKEFAWVEPCRIDCGWILAFLDELSHWDGCLRPSGCMTYTNTNRQAIDKVMALAALSGQRASLYEAPLSGNRKPSWQVTVSGKSYINGRGVERSSVPYDGYVYCVGVPTGMIVTRYDGKITVSGNTHTFHYIVESLSLDQREIFNMYHEVNSIHDKDAFEMTLTADIMDPNFSTDSVEGVQKFLKNLIGFYVIMEGIFFYSGFVMILSFKRQNRMAGIGEQFEYIMRDESTHLSFGADLINGIKAENPEAWTPELAAEIEAMIAKAVELEIAYAEDCLPKGILGLNANLFREYVQHIADRRLERIGLAPKYGSKNPFPWMSETIDLGKEKNFFETRVTEYQTGGALSW